MNDNTMSGWNLEKAKRGTDGKGKRKEDSKKNWKARAQ